MDAGSDSSRCELDSIASADSLQMITDEFRLHHLSTPDVLNVELSKRVASLELDNERLRIDLENARIEINAKNAANQGLKNKIAELYMEAHSSLQEKQKLHNSVKDAQCRLVAAENSTKWYQGQMHEVQANKKSLQVEIDTYQSMLRQKHQTLVNITAKWKQLNEDYLLAVQKHKKEKDILQAEIELLKKKDHSLKSCNLQPQPQQQSSVPMSTYQELECKLETADEELQDARAELRALEQRLMSVEVEKASLESGMVKLRTLLSSQEDSLQRCQSERAELAEIGGELRIELQKLRSENETLQMSLLSSRQEHEQVEDAIEQLRSQLSKMIAQHRLLKSRNAELEEKLNAMQDIYNENKRLKSLSYSANASLFRRLRQERRKANHLQKQLCQEQSRQRALSEKTKVDSSIKDCLKQALERNKELKDQLLKSTKVSEESLDEGYADSASSVISVSLTNLPSPRPLSPVLLNTITDILSKSKNFWDPLHLGLNELHAKLENYKGEKITSPSSVFYDSLQLSTPPPSPPSNIRSVI
ncbi:hypothetical protein TSAR_016267 [Trichomalopsis sarcophagae]|uniref:Uncharacterized protein n=1 Tax=Trichomalopsis sarcophagae TaxID=543379 RepID=A0A232F507_9HYME|nr:hypothetical protein TSAR_016267 [Trichomalopsis sarcophagae]